MNITVSCPLDAFFFYPNLKKHFYYQGIEAACVLHCTCLLKDPYPVPRSAAVDAVEEAQQLLTERHAAL